MFLSTELPSRNFCVRERMRTTKHHWYKPSIRVLLLKSSISNDVQVLMDRKEIEGDSIINNDMNGIVYVEEASSQYVCRV